MIRWKITKYIENIFFYLSFLDLYFYVLKFMFYYLYIICLLIVKKVTDLLIIVFFDK